MNGGQTKNLFLIFLFFFLDSFEGSSAFLETFGQRFVEILSDDWLFGIEFLIEIRRARGESAVDFLD